VTAALGTVRAVSETGYFFWVDHHRSGDCLGRVLLTGCAPAAGVAFGGWALPQLGHTTLAFFSASSWRKAENV